MEQYPRIYISRSQKEWELIDKRIQELGKKNLHAFLRSRLNSLKNEFINCPDCICSGLGPKIQRSPYIDAEQFEVLMEISRQTKIPEGIIVNKLILEPLLFIP